MSLQQQPLRQLFHEIVAECYGFRLGMDDSEISSYVADLLTDFCRMDHLYSMHAPNGEPLREIDAMATAADPVYGSASSFDAERELRKHIGDYSLFLTGMYPDSMHLWRSRGIDSFADLVETGKESYYIVSQFDLFEYKQEAPFFARLAGAFEECVCGLNYVREELDRLRTEGSRSGGTTPRVM